MNRITLLSLAILCLSSELVYADMNSANAALARGDYATASAEYLRLANNGNEKAQAHLGYMYYVGEGVQQDYAEAIKWYRKAGVQGNKDAQYNLAVAYAFGEGTKQDYKEAATWYRRAAEQGHVVAQYSLGISYSYGEGVKQDSAEALKWFKLSAEQGYARSQVQLATKYHTGDGVELDYQEAVMWYRRAADRGNAAAQYNLGSMFRSGKGVKQDYNQAVRWYRMAADQGYAAATNELASLERAIAGATRTRSTPNLQPRPAPVEAAAKKEPLVSVKKSDLLTLDEEIDQVEETVVADVESTVDSSDEMEVVEEMQPEEKKPGRVSGFFKKFFKKKEVPTETAMVETSEPESIEEMQEGSVPVEDMSEPITESIADEEMEMEREVVSSETEEKKSRFGFFKKLFGKKDATEAADVEDRSIAEAESEEAISYESEEDIQTSEMADTAEVIQEEEVAVSDMEAEEPPKKKGFFGRLFSKKEDNAEEIIEDSETISADSIAMVDDSADNIPILEEEIEIDTSAEEDAAMDALEVEEKPKKKGFFKRLFSKSDDEDTAGTSEDIAESDDDNSVQTATGPTYVAEESELAVGQKALDEGDYDVAFNTFYDLATQGDATAQYQLGLLYYQGLGIRQNYDEASHWYLRAGQQGHADAQYSLGNMFLMGEGVAQDDEKAISMYQLAADQGHDAARHNVTNLKRVSTNKSVSAEEIETALENEQTGDGLTAEDDVEAEPKKGFFGRLFGKKDDVEEINEENVAVVQGPLPEIQSEPATEEIEVAEVEEVKEKKKGFFGRLFSKKEKDDEEAMEAESEAMVEAEQSAAAAMPSAEPEQSFEEALAAVKEYENGLAYSFGDGVAQNNEAAFTAFLRSAELGHAPAQYKTGVAYAYGEGVEKNPAQAVHWYKKAAEQGYALAQRNLGVMYMNGDGVEQNKPLAYAWHSIVADSGNVMDVHRRDSLQKQLSEAEIEEALSIKASLKH